MIIRKFEEQVEKFRDKIALGTGDEALTYEELNRRANQAAVAIASARPAGNSDKQQCAALLFEHGIDMIIGLIGALKANMIYVPLDRTHPESRLNYMLEDSEARLVLTDTQNLPLAKKLGKKTAIIDIRALSHGQPGENVEREVFRKEPAYILYTSGSTGKPKGVVQNHENVLYYTRNWTERFDISASGRMTLLTAFVHDGAVQDTWGALHNGAALYPYDVKTLSTGTPLPEFIVKEKITIWHSVPTLYRYFVENLEDGTLFPYLRFILLGGEPLRKRDIDIFKQYFPAAALANVYGQTESSVASIAVYTAKDSFGMPVLGEPLDETEIFLVNEDDEIVEDIGTGEIIIACAYIAPGYWKDPGKTREKFAHDPELGRLYRTGDLGGLKAGGGIEILGRKDFQIKIRGFRVETGEIETLLLRHEAVKEAVVLLKEEKEEPFLCCYFTTHGPAGTIGAEELRQYLLGCLPDYMVPGVFVQLEKFPLTASGKVDRNALPAPGLNQAAHPPTPPANEKEARLAKIWSEELSVPLESIGGESHFFELGGHSLRAINLIAKVHRQFHVKLELEDIFTYPLLKQLSRHIASKEEDVFHPITPAEAREYYPLSPAQRRLYILQQLETGGTVYNLSDIVEWAGELDKKRLEHAVQQLINRHDSFRTSFLTVNHQPVQRIHKKVKFNIEYYNSPSSKVFWIKTFIRPFNLTRAPLFRLGVISLAEDRHLLLLDMHHIITDGVSLQVFNREFKGLYPGQELPFLRLQYKDYSLWQGGGGYREGAEYREAFWLRQFEGEIPVLDLPADYKRPAVQRFEGSKARFSLTAAETGRLRALAKKEDATLYMVLLAVIDVFLFKISGREDIVVGTPVAGRRHADLENMVGMLVNTLALRNYPCGEKSFFHLLREIRRNTLDAFENQDYPFEDLVEKISPHRDLSRNPLFDVMFALHNQAEIPGGGSKDDSYRFEGTVSPFDLTVYAAEAGEGLELIWEYSTNLFKKETIHRYFSYYRNIANRLAGAPYREIAKIEIIPPEEKQQILCDFNDTTAAYPEAKPLRQLFVEQAGKTPGNIAVTAYGAGVSYGELNKRSDGLARRLKEKGAQPDTIVAIKVPRSLEMIIGIIGILKTGGVYLPIDPGYPEKRADYMLKDSNVRILLAEKGQIKTAPVGTGMQKQIPAMPAHIGPPRRGAYIIYTSGTTGRPKGVMVEQRNVTAYLHAFAREFAVTPRDTFLQQFSYSFDAFIEEVYPALFHGAKIAIAAGEEILDIHLLAEFIVKHDISMISCSPLMLNQLNRNEGLKTAGIRIFISGGDVLKGEYINNLPAERVYNTYGPTETTVCAAYSRYTGDFSDNIPIGKPIANYKIYILDKTGNLLPVGVTGELCIAGAGVARGYLNNPGLTGEQFVKDPYNPGKRMYRTGDLGRWLSGGSIEFSGRLDQQVKIRGYRIELGEIEARLLKYKEVKQAAVVLREDKSGDKYLCAYTDAGGELREFLSQTLPAYMVPAYFVQLEKIPVKANGKLDHSALPEPGIKARRDHTAPTGEIEAQLVRLWSEVLGIEEREISTSANFFELGGHSLRAAVMTSGIHRALDVKVPLGEVFKQPTIRGLARYIETAAEDRYTDIEPAPVQGDYELSPAQKRMYILQQMDTQGTVYNISSVIPLDAGVDPGGLRHVFIKLIQRHESLRTSFHMIDDVPVQRIHDNVEFEIEYHDLATGQRRREETHHSSFIIHHSFIRPFDLSAAPLLRVGLVNVGAPGYLLIADMHHIITDGISSGILGKDFLALYRGEELSPLRIQYKDYAHWQNRRLKTRSMKKQEDFWLREFSGEIPVLNLPYDYPRPMIRQFAGSRAVFRLGKPQTRALKALASAANATLYMVLLAIFDILSAKISGREDIILGTPVAGRGHADLHNIIGMFVNTLALRNYPSAGKTFNQFLAELKQGTLQAFENQDYPFEDLVDKLALSRDAGRNPLFDVMFVLQNQAEYTAHAVARGGPSKDGPEGIERQVAKFDITLEAVEIGDGLQFSLLYCTKLFKPGTIQRFIAYFKCIAARVSTDPGVLLGNIQIISQKEKQKILLDFNRTAALYPRDKTISRLFEEQAERMGNGVAVIGPAHGARHMAITYRQLNNASGRLASRLVEKGVKPGSIAAVTGQRSIETIAGILAVLKAGAAYLPIDPGYPEERIDYMLKDSGAAILSAGDTGKKFPPSSPFTLHPSPLTPLAYIIYTSGSTGRPKGVMVEQRSVVRLVKNTNYIKFNSKDRLLQTGALEFDASTFEIWGALLNGLTLCIGVKEQILSAEMLKRAVRRYDIAVMWLTAPLFNGLSGIDIDIFAGLKYLLVGGDVLSPPHINRVRKKFPRLNIINGYGPTENTTFSTTFLIKTSYEDQIPIGKPIANSTAYIFDKNGNPQPIGITGELFVGGDGIASGYLNNPELTAEKFLDKSFAGCRGGFSKEPLPAGGISSKLYSTGDLARWLAGGNIEFLGRLDFQVKVRGFRIETGEIENCLLKHKHIKEAVVLVKGDDSGGKYLCAYIVGSGTELKEYLARALPAHMIPTHFVFLEKIPLTANGKVDRRALSSLETAAPGRTHAAPRGTIEKKLVRVWSGVLGMPVDKIGIKDNFFQLGGHSLRAAVMAAKLHKIFGVKISLKEIFRYQTVKELSTCIQAAAKEEYAAVRVVEEKEYHILSSAQERLYFIRQMLGESIVYNIPITITLSGDVDKRKIEEVFRELIRRHGALRTSFILKNGEPVQVIHKEVEFEIGNYSAADGPFVRPFDLSRAPLLRVGLQRLEGGKRLLLVDMHHIISDGTSIGILVKEFSALQAGGELPPLRIQYKDYAEWQQRFAKDLVQAQQKEYWLKEFEKPSPVLDLPLDFPRPPVQRFEGGAVTFEPDTPAARPIDALALEENASRFMVILAVFNLLLAGLGGREDIVVGTPTAGRNHEDLRPLIGMFVNTLALRNYPPTHKSFREFLRDVRRRALDAFDNQDYPFEELVELLEIHRDTGRHPIFDVMLSLQNFAESPGSAPYGGKSRISKFDLTLTALENTENPDRLSFVLEYSSHLFKEETAQRFAGYFKRILAQVLENPGRSIVEIIEKGTGRKYRPLPPPKAAAAEIEPAKAADGGTGYEAPRNTVQGKLIETWAKILGLEKERIGIKSNFFELGGNSLKIIKLLAEIYEVFDVQIPVLQIFKTPILEDIAAFLMQSKFEKSEEDVFILLNPGKPANIFAFPPAIGYGIVYMQLTDLLPRCSIYAFNYIEGEGRMETYVETIKNIHGQPRRPITLLGYSAGGRLCVKAAGLLEKQGYTVSDIIIMDAYPRRPVLPPDEAEALSKEFNQQLKTGMEAMGLAFMAAKVLERMEKYNDYHDTLVDLEPVHAHIHLIRADDKKGDKTLKGWDDLTRGEYRCYDGSGIHREMLSPGFVEKNAALISGILTGVPAAVRAGKMPFGEDILAAHKTLSEYGLRFLEFVHQDPRRLETSAYRDISSHYDLNPWPTFVSPHSQEEIRAAAVTTCKLLKSVPQRVFKNDPHKMARYYELPVNMIRTQLIGVDDAFLDTLMARGDFVLTPPGFKCLEYNIAGNIGGMEVPFWEAMYLQNPVIAQFLHENRVKINNKNLLDLFLEHLVETARAMLPGLEDILNIAVVFTGNQGNTVSGAVPAGLNQLYAKTLRRLEDPARGSIISCDFQQLHVGDDDFVYHEDKRVHILIETYGGVVPPEILAAFKSRRVCLFNGPVTGLLSNKLNLALLSEHEDSPIFNEEEKKAIKKYIPWTRKIVPGETMYNGEKIQLTDFIALNREKLVMKPAVGFGGERIYIGKHMAQEEWEKRLAIAAKARKWLVQEYAPSLPLVYLAGEASVRPHQAVWGFFVFGSRFGGAIVRVLPQNDKKGIVNVQQGASVTVLFDVDR